MISWSIEAARSSQCFEKILVSTDDAEISNVARECGADVPFVRPTELSGDFASTQSVVAHAIQWQAKQGNQYEAVCCLYATAPFVSAADLRQSEQSLSCSEPGTVVFAASSFSFPIQRALRLNGDGYASMFYPNMFHCRSQDLEEAFHDAGQFYWASPETWLKTENLFQNGRPLILPRWRVQDIDTEEDWRRAEIMHQIIEMDKS